MPIFKSMPFAASVLTLALAGQAAIAEDVVINLGYAAAEGSSYAVLADKFEELAEEYSGGSIDVKVRWYSSLSLIVLCFAQSLSENSALKYQALATPRLKADDKQ